MIDKYLPLILKFLKFLGVGALATGFDFAVTWLLKEKLKFNKYLASGIGFSLSAVGNYLLNRIWTFGSSNPEIFSEFGKFFGIAVIGLGINSTILFFLTKKLRLPFYMAKLVATGITIFWNFGANLIFTFTK